MLVVDIVLNVLLFTKLFLARQMIQGFIGALKLKVEFLVLNSLVDYTQFKSSSEAGLSWSDKGMAFPQPIGESIVQASQKQLSETSIDYIATAPYTPVGKLQFG